MKAQLFRVYLCCHELPVDGQVGPFGCDGCEAFGDGLPTWASIEVLQGDLHVLTVNVAARCKVKWCDGSMRIGHLAALTGVSTQALRFYERKGLLPTAARESNGYRVYEDDAAVAQVGFIRAAQGAGLKLTEIAGVLELREAGQAPCSHVRSLLNREREEIRARQTELARLEAELSRMIEASLALDPSACSPSSVCNVIPH